MCLTIVRIIPSEWSTGWDGLLLSATFNTYKSESIQSHYNMLMSLMKPLYINEINASAHDSAALIDKIIHSLFYVLHST